MRERVRTSRRAGTNPGRRSGVLPNARVKLVVNEPTLDSPTAMQMSATVRSVPRNMAAARSSRRVCR